MSWNNSQKPKDIKDFLKDLYTTDTDDFRMEVIEIKIVSITTAFLALKQIKDGVESIVAGICLMRFAKNIEFNFSYKALLEHSGVVHRATCPVSILNKLTPLEDSLIEDLNAAQWRTEQWLRVRLSIAREKATTGSFWFHPKGIQFTCGNNHWFMMEGRNRARLPNYNNAIGKMKQAHFNQMIRVDIPQQDGLPTLNVLERAIDLMRIQGTAYTPSDRSDVSNRIYAKPQKHFDGNQQAEQLKHARSPCAVYVSCPNEQINLF